VHLKIKYDESDSPWFDDVIEREAIIQAFVPPILDFSKNFDRAEKEWYTPKRLVAKFYKAITAGIPLRSDVHAPQPVECLVKDGYGVGYIDGRVFFHISFEDETLISILLFDTHPFWPQVLDFLENIASGSLPAGCEHLSVIEWNMPPEIPTKIRTLTRLVAEPLDVPENFRLKIFTTYHDESKFLLLDEVVDRRQFAHGFTESFKKFLKKKYRIEPDKDGKTFDLRTLSLEKIEQA
jgi:hypothetical protein